MKQCKLLNIQFFSLLAGLLLSSAAFADDLPDAPTPKIPQDAAAQAMAQKICEAQKQPESDCEVQPARVDDHDDEATSHFYLNVVMSWEYSFTEGDWQAKVFYNGAYRVVDKATGRQYDVFRFDNEQGVPFNEKADIGSDTVHDFDHIYDVKAYQTQQKDKNGNYASDDDELMTRSKFVGQIVDEKDYDRGLHYFIAIPIGWDRTYTKDLGHGISVASENEVGVGGVAYAGIFQANGQSNGHVGANIIRTVNAVAFNFTKGSNSFTVTPMEFTNDCAAFSQGVNCEWEASGQFEYENDKTGLGVTVEAAHKTGLSAWSTTESENILRVGVSVDPVKAAQGLVKVAKKGSSLFKKKHPDDENSN